ncbi:MAG: hypothetical protein KW793_01385 [Candidatus Doudnabacteria bacterium]|nr:hypothetical protein [Candidatus Doudnabacteria bacterium]
MRKKQQISIFKSITGSNTLLGKFKLSGIVFGSVLIVGLSMAAVQHFKNGTDVKLAKVVQEVTTDKIESWWYEEHFGTSTCESDACKDDADPDADKLTNRQEFFYGSNPNKRDTNDNGLTDGEDVAFGYAPKTPGKVTFDEASSDQNIFGESLVFNDEVKELIVDMTDLNKVLIPEVADSELTIIYENTKESFTEYMLKLDQVSQKYHTQDDQFSFLEQAIKQQNKVQLEEVSLMALNLAEEYRKIPVPSDALTLHKYHIVLWKNLPKILKTPSPENSSDIDSINEWYDSVRVMMALNQKVQVELDKLRSKYE